MKSTRYKSLLSEQKHLASKHFFADRAHYESELKKAQSRVVKLQQSFLKKHRKAILLFEGPDAAGKGGAISRFTRFLDPRGFHVFQTGAPSEAEKREFYFERFFRQLPAPGRFLILDRSWYGRVLAERVKKIIPRTDWKRAYSEINLVESMLSNNKIPIVKCFLDLTYPEQAKRFKERRENPYKSWKLTSEDLWNRKHWGEYHLAFKEMILKTNTSFCAWRVFPADSKWKARVDILNYISDRLL